MHEKAFLCRYISICIYTNILLYDSGFLDEGIEGGEDAVRAAEAAPPSSIKDEVAQMVQKKSSIHEPLSTNQSSPSI
jgi:hypothetical protein